MQRDVAARQLVPDGQVRVVVLDLVGGWPPDLGRRRSCRRSGSGTWTAGRWRRLVRCKSCLPCRLSSGGVADRARLAAAWWICAVWRADCAGRCPDTGVGHLVVQLGR